MKVLVYGWAPDDIVNRLKQNYIEVEHLSPNQGKDSLIAWLARYGKSTEYVLTGGRDGFPAEYFDYLPNLKLISSQGAGYDGIDVQEAVVKRGILVTNTPNIVSAETSTTAIMLYLACYRDFNACERYARSGKWQEGGFPPLTHTTDDRKVGILGLGRIGSEIAKKLQAFDCTIVYHSRRWRPDVPFTYYSDLLQMAKDVECLICVVPGGETTRHIVNQDVINALGPKGVLINVGRGSVVDEKALIKALQEKRLGWAGLDVYEHEPRIPLELRTLENTVLLPHTGSATVETRKAMGDLAVANILQHVEGGTVLTPIPECKQMNVIFQDINTPLAVETPADNHRQAVRCIM